MFSLRMRRNLYLGGYGTNSDTGIRFLDPDFLIDSKFRRFEDVFS